MSAENRFTVQPLRPESNRRWRSFPVFVFWILATFFCLANVTIGRSVQDHSTAEIMLIMAVLCTLIAIVNFAWFVAGGWTDYPLDDRERDAFLDPGR